MVQVNMHEAKAQLSRLGELACKGERVVIAKNGKPYLDLVPHQEEQRREPRKLGVWKGESESARTSSGPRTSCGRCSARTSSGRPARTSGGLSR